MCVRAADTEKKATRGSQKLDGNWLLGNRAGGCVKQVVTLTCSVHPKTAPFFVQLPEGPNEKYNNSNNHTTAWPFQGLIKPCI